jgi:hypothetical protein
LKSILRILKTEKNEIELLWRYWMMVIDRQRWISSLIESKDKIQTPIFRDLANFIIGFI